MLSTRLMFVVMAVLTLGGFATNSLAGGIVALTNNNTDDSALSASSGNAVWQGKDPNGSDWEIFLYCKDSNDVKQLTHNDVNDVNPVLAGCYAAWERWDGNDWEICVYNGDKVIQITDNDVDDIEPKLSAPFLFWRSWDGNDWEIHKTTLPRSPIGATCTITPKTLNLKSKGNWIEAMLLLPKDISTGSVDTGTILLQGQLSPEKVMVYEKTRIIHMKFSRSQLEAILTPAAAVKLDITVYLKDGTKIFASDTIRVIH